MESLNEAPPDTDIFMQDIIFRAEIDGYVRGRGFSDEAGRQRFRDLLREQTRSLTPERDRLQSLLATLRPGRQGAWTSQRLVDVLRAHYQRDPEHFQELRAFTERNDVLEFPKHMLRRYEQMMSRYAFLELWTERLGAPGPILQENEASPTRVYLERLEREYRGDSEHEEAHFSSDVQIRALGVFQTLNQWQRAIVQPFHIALVENAAWYVAWLQLRDLTFIREVNESFRISDIPVQEGYLRNVNFVWLLLISRLLRYSDFRRHFDVITREKFARVFGFVFQFADRALMDVLQNELNVLQVDLNVRLDFRKLASTLWRMPHPDYIIRHVVTARWQPLIEALTNYPEMLNTVIISRLVNEFFGYMPWIDDVVEFSPEACQDYYEKFIHYGFFSSVCCVANHFVVVTLIAEASSCVVEVEDPMYSDPLGTDPFARSQFLARHRLLIPNSIFNLFVYLASRRQLEREERPRITLVESFKAFAMQWAPEYTQVDSVQCGWRCLMHVFGRSFNKIFARKKRWTEEIIRIMESGLSAFSLVVGEMLTGDTVQPSRRAHEGRLSRVDGFPLFTWAGPERVPDTEQPYAEFEPPNSDRVAALLSVAGQIQPRLRPTIAYVRGESRVLAVEPIAEAASFGEPSPDNFDSNLRIPFSQDSLFEHMQRQNSVEALSHQAERSEPEEIEVEPELPARPPALGYVAQIPHPPERLVSIFSNDPVANLEPARALPWQSSPNNPSTILAELRAPQLPMGPVSIFAELAEAQSRPRQSLAWLHRQPEPMNIQPPLPFVQSRPIVPMIAEAEPIITEPNRVVAEAEPMDAEVGPISEQDEPLALPSPPPLPPHIESSSPISYGRLFAEELPSSVPAEGVLVVSPLAPVQNISRNAGPELPIAPAERADLTRIYATIAFENAEILRRDITENRHSRGILADLMPPIRLELPDELVERGEELLHPRFRRITIFKPEQKQALQRSVEVNELPLSPFERRLVEFYVSETEKVLRQLDTEIMFKAGIGHLIGGTEPAVRRAQTSAENTQQQKQLPRQKKTRKQRGRKVGESRPIRDPILGQQSSLYSYILRWLGLRQDTFDKNYTSEMAHYNASKEAISVMLLSGAQRNRRLQQLEKPKRKAARREDAKKRVRREIGSQFDRARVKRFYQKFANRKVRWRLLSRIRGLIRVIFFDGGEFEDDHQRAIGAGQQFAGAFGGVSRPWDEMPLVGAPQMTLYEALRELAEAMRDSKLNVSTLRPVRRRWSGNRMIEEDAEQIERLQDILEKTLQTFIENEWDEDWASAHERAKRRAKDMQEFQREAEDRREMIDRIDRIGGDMEDRWTVDLKRKRPRDFAAGATGGRKKPETEEAAPRARRENTNIIESLRHLGFSKDELTKALGSKKNATFVERAVAWTVARNSDAFFESEVLQPLAAGRISYERACFLIRLVPQPKMALLKARLLQQTAVAQPRIQHAQGAPQHFVEPEFEHEFPKNYVIDNRAQGVLLRYEKYPPAFRDSKRLTMLNYYKQHKNEQKVAWMLAFWERQDKKMTIVAQPAARISPRMTEPPNNEDPFEGIKLTKPQEYYENAIAWFMAKNDYRPLRNALFLIDQGRFTREWLLDLLNRHANSFSKSQAERAELTILEHWKEDAAQTFRKYDIFTKQGQRAIALSKENEPEFFLHLSDLLVELGYDANARNQIELGINSALAEPVSSTLRQLAQDLSTSEVERLFVQENLRNLEDAPFIAKMSMLLAASSSQDLNLSNAEYKRYFTLFQPVPRDSENVRFFESLDNDFKDVQIDNAMELYAKIRRRKLSKKDAKRVLAWWRARKARQRAERILDIRKRVREQPPNLVAALEEVPEVVEVGEEVEPQAPQIQEPEVTEAEVVQAHENARQLAFVGFMKQYVEHPQLELVRASCAWAPLFNRLEPVCERCNSRLTHELSSNSLILKCEACRVQANAGVSLHEQMLALLGADFEWDNLSESRHFWCTPVQTVAANWVWGWGLQNALIEMLEIQFSASPQLLWDEIMNRLPVRSANRTLEIFEEFGIAWTPDSFARGQPHDELRLTVPEVYTRKTAQLLRNFAILTPTFPIEIEAHPDPQVTAWRVRSQIGIQKNSLVLTASGQIVPASLAHASNRSNTFICSVAGQNLIMTSFLYANAGSCFELVESGAANCVCMVLWAETDRAGDEIFIAPWVAVKTVRDVHAGEFLTIAKPPENLVYQANLNEGELNETRTINRVFHELSAPMQFRIGLRQVRATTIRSLYSRTRFERVGGGPLRTNVARYAIADRIQSIVDPNPWYRFYCRPNLAMMLGTIRMDRSQFRASSLINDVLFPASVQQEFETFFPNSVRTSERDFCAWLMLGYTSIFGAQHFRQHSVGIRGAMLCRFDELDLQNIGTQVQTLRAWINAQWNFGPTPSDAQLSSLNLWILPLFEIIQKAVYAQTQACEVYRDLTRQVSRLAPQVTETVNINHQEIRFYFQLEPESLSGETYNEGSKAVAIRVQAPTSGWSALRTDTSASQDFVVDTFEAILVQFAVTIEKWKEQYDPKKMDHAILAQLGLLDSEDDDEDAADDIWTISVLNAYSWATRSQFMAWVRVIQRTLSANAFVPSFDYDLQLIQDIQTQRSIIEHRRARYDAAVRVLSNYCARLVNLTFNEDDVAFSIFLREQEWEQLTCPVYAAWRERHPQYDCINSLARFFLGQNIRNAKLLRILGLKHIRQLVHELQRRGHSVGLYEALERTWTRRVEGERYILLAPLHATLVRAEIVLEERLPLEDRLTSERGAHSLTRDDPQPDPTAPISERQTASFPYIHPHLSETFRQNRLYFDIESLPFRPQIPLCVALWGWISCSETPISRIFSKNELLDDPIHEFVKYLIEVLRPIYIKNVQHKRSQTVQIWSFNGNHYDNKFLIPYFTRYFKKIRSYGGANDSKGLEIGEFLLFRDARLLYTSGSLQSLSHQYCEFWRKGEVEGVGGIAQINTWRLWKAHQRSVQQYNRIDVLATAQLVERFYTKMFQIYNIHAERNRASRNNIDSFARKNWTCSQIALTIYRNCFIRHDESLSLSRHYDPLLADQRANYRGGLVEVYQNIPKSFRNPRLAHTKVDVSSEYPFVMRRGPLPYYYGGVWALDEARAALGEGQINFVVLLREFQIPLNAFSPICVTWKHIAWYVNRASFRREERYLVGGSVLRYIQSVGGSWDAYEAHFYTDVVGGMRNNSIRRYIDTFYRLKSDTRDPLQRTLFKLLMNSLYGKLGQDQKQLIEFVDEDVFPMSAQIVMSVPRNEFTELHKEIEKQTFHVGNLCRIARAITELGRVHICQLAEIAGRGNVFYIDTDSLDVNAAGLANLRNAGKITAEGATEQLGALKIEGNFQSAIYLARKNYAHVTITAQGTETEWKAKGINHRWRDEAEKHQFFTRARASLVRAMFTQVIPRHLAPEQLRHAINLDLSLSCQQVRTSKSYDSVEFITLNKRLNLNLRRRQIDGERSEPFLQEDLHE